MLAVGNADGGVNAADAPVVYDEDIAQGYITALDEKASEYTTSLNDIVSTANTNLDEFVTTTKNELDETIAVAETNVQNAVTSCGKSVDTCTQIQSDIMEIAENMGNPVVDVTESNGTVTIKKTDNTINEFDIVKTINGITPTSGDIDINRKFYNSLAQLGLNYDTVTFDQIANTLPVNSTLTFYVDIVTSQPAYAPNLDIPVSGFIVVTKGANNTVPIKFTLSPIANNATTYLGEYTTYNSYGFKGWQPIVLSVNGAKPNYTGNVTVPVDTYTAWNWTDGYTVIDGFTVKFPNGYKQCVWYLYFPSGYSAMNINFPKAFSAPPCVFGSIIVANDSTHLTANVYNVTATSCRCVTNNSGSTGTYWIAVGYDS